MIVYDKLKMINAGVGVYSMNENSISFIISRSNFISSEFIVIFWLINIYGLRPENFLQHLLTVICYNQADFVKIRAKPFFHFQAVCDNHGISISSVFVPAALALTCCKAGKITSLAKAIKGGLISSNAKAKHWRVKVQEATKALKQTNSIDCPNTLKLVEFIFPNIYG